MLQDWWRFVSNGPSRSPIILQYSGLFICTNQSILNSSAQQLQSWIVLGNGAPPSLFLHFIYSLLFLSSDTFKGLNTLENCVLVCYFGKSWCSGLTLSPRWKDRHQFRFCASNTEQNYIIGRNRAAWATHCSVSLLYSPFSPGLTYCHHFSFSFFSTGLTQHLSYFLHCFCPIFGCLCSPIWSDIRFPFLIQNCQKLSLLYQLLLCF